VFYEIRRASFPSSFFLVPFSCNKICEELKLIPAKFDLAARETEAHELPCCYEIMASTSPKERVEGKGTDSSEKGCLISTSWGRCNAAPLSG